MTFLVNACKSGGELRPTDGNPNELSGVTSHLVQVGSVQREYLVHVPAGTTLVQALPVVISFHGGNSNAQWQMRRTGLNRSADEHNYLVVYPQGTPAIIGN